MLSHAISSLRRRARSFGEVKPTQPDIALRAKSWRLYDYLWMDLTDRPGLLVKAGPSVHPIVVRLIPWVLRHVSLASESVATYHLLAGSLSLFNTRRSFLGHGQLQHSVREVGATVGHMGLVPRSNWTLVMRLFIDVYPDEESLDKLQVCYKEWDRCGEDGAACSAEFTQAVLLFVIKQGSETGVEHCCRVVDSHLSHVLQDGKSHWRVPEGFTMIFEQHLNETTKNVQSNEQDATFWDSMDDILFTKCLQPLLEAGQCDLLLDEKRTTFKFLPQIIDYYVARRSHARLTEVVRSMTKWILSGASKWPAADARAALSSLDVLLSSRVRAFGSDGVATEGLKTAVSTLVSIMSIVVKKADGAGDIEIMRNAILELHVPCEGNEDVDSMATRTQRKLSQGSSGKTCRGNGPGSAV